MKEGDVILASIPQSDGGQTSTHNGFNTNINVRITSFC